ncbi:alpha/beta hydrolase [Lederbergia citrisecunda]|uniref:alpha/beta fold hydrolase n=1 Tax=Lederbergia citrisecunda TaxID=2833583 RepID=UPI003D2A70BE
MSEISRMIVINNKNLEIQQKGNRGTPIVIVTGMGNSFDEWHEVTEALSKRNTVIMFHRPGLGRSEIGDESRTTQAVADELKELLTQLNIVEPFILVGHSYGGLCAQHFAKLYPSHLRGLVLVDSTSVDFQLLDDLTLPVLNEDSTDEAWIEKCNLYSSMNKDELSKILNPSLTRKQKQFPPEIQERLMDFQVNPTLYKAMCSEIKNWKVDAEIIKGLGDFLNLPLVVIGRDKEHCIQLGVDEGFPEWEIRIFEDKWQELIMDQVNLSSNSKLIFAERSGHLLYMDRPDVLIQSITELNSDSDT